MDHRHADSIRIHFRLVAILHEIVHYVQSFNAPQKCINKLNEPYTGSRAVGHCFKQIAFGCIVNL